MSKSRTGKSTPPSITSWGATRAVTGSQHLLQTETQRILLDCGLILEKGSQLRNREFPFDPCSIDAVILTHAHLDHCGNLPTLVKQGFRGPIYCTPATRDLLWPMLEDAANVQNFETQWYNHKRSLDEPWLSPLYLQNDVQELMKLLHPLPCDTLCQLDDSAAFQFREAGHVLGSASVHVQLTAGQRQRTLTYTGDVGRSGIPFLRPVASLLPSDLVLSEATYGGQFHESYEALQDKLAAIVERTIDRGGKVLIPAFSLGRVQLVVFTLIRLIEQGRLAPVPILVDSPLANRILHIVLQHVNDLHPSAISLVKQKKPFLHASYVQYLQTVEESKDAMLDATPAIVIASSGMGEGGRIVHYLKQHIDDPRCTIALVSFQSPGSLGARLLEQAPTVRIAGREWNKWADVETLRGFSGHADHLELLDLLGPLISHGSRISLVHGEEHSLSAMQSALCQLRPGCAEIAERGTTISLN